MWLLFEYHNDVTLKHVRHLFALSLKQYFLVVRHTLLNTNLECLRLYDHFLAAACLTVFLIGAAFASTLVTRLLHLHLHESHVLSHRHRPLAFALGASLGLAALGARALALGAVDVASDAELLLRAIVELL